VEIHETSEIRTGSRAQRKATPPKTETPERQGTRGEPAFGDLGAYYFHCAINSFDSKNYWAAVEYCKKALTHREESKFYRLMAKSLAIHQAFRGEAMDAYRRALEIDPESIAIEREIADLYFADGNFALARARYMNILKKNPEDLHCQQQLKAIARSLKS
jgi:tetratricopeptide (TPR) repeat protein